MRVPGACRRVPYTRFGFSPQAIFMVLGASGKRISSAESRGTRRSVTPWPPTRLAEPGSTWIVVTPPARARSRAGSCGQNESTARTSGLKGPVDSLPSEWARTEGTA